MKTLKILLFCFGLGPGLWAQVYDVRVGDKWGFINEKGEWIVEPTYDFVYEYDYSAQEWGLFVIRESNRFGLYHAKKGLLLTPRYDAVQVNQTNSLTTATWADSMAAFSRSGTCLFRHQQQAYEIALIAQNLFTCRLGDQKGAWDFEGRLVLPARYDSIECYPSNHHFTDKSGFECQFLIAQAGSYYSLWDRTGNCLVRDWPGQLKIVSERAIMMEDTIQRGRFALAKLNGERMSDSLYLELKAYKQYFTFKQTKNGKTGLLDSLGQPWVPALYDGFRVEADRYVWTKQNYFWGLLDPDGKTLFKTIFSRPGWFFGPVAVVKKDTSYGLINRFGDLLCEPKYEQIRMYEGVARVRVDSTWEQIAFHENGRLDTRLRLIVLNRKRMAFDTHQFNLSGEELTLYRANWIKLEQKYGLLDSTHERFLIPPSFETVHLIPERNLAVTGKYIKATGQRLQGLVDLNTGKELLRPTVNHIYHEDFRSGPVARVQYGNGAFSLLNRRGKLLRLSRMGYIDPFTDGLARAMQGMEYLTPPSPGEKQDSDEVSKLKGKWGLLRSNGTWEIKPHYDWIAAAYGGYSLARKGDQWGLLNSEGRELLAPGFDGLEIPKSTGHPEQGVNRSAPGFVMSATRQAKFFYLDSLGHLLFTCVAEESRDFQEGKVLIREAGKWGYRDKTGQWLIPPQFEKAGDFSNDRAPVRLRQRWGYIDAEGNWLVKPQYYAAGAWRDGRALVKTRTRFGYLDSTGNWALKPKYRRASDFANGRAIVRKGKRYGLIDPAGKWKIPPRYSRITREPDRLVARRKGKFYAFSLLGGKGTKIRRPKRYRDTLPEIPQRAAIMSQYGFDSLRVAQEGIQIGEFVFLQGIFDPYAGEVLPQIYERVRKVGSLFKVTHDGFIGYLDEAGNWVFPLPERP